MSAGISGWLVSVGVPAACMGVAYLFSSGRKFFTFNGQSPAINDVSNSKSPNKSVNGSNGNNKKKQEKRMRKRQRHQQVNSLSNSAPVSFVTKNVESLSSSESENEDDVGLVSTESDLIQLARLKRLANESTSHSSISSLSASTLVNSSSGASIAMQGIPNTHEEDQKEWNKINRHEETVQSLKSRIATLTDQVDSLTRDNREQQRLVESGTRRVAALENEVKERSRVLSYQLSKSENELLKSRKELESNQEQLGKVASLSEELKDLNDKCSAMQTLIAKSEQDSHAVINTNEQLIKDRSLLQSEVAALHRQLEEARKENTEKAKALQDTMQFAQKSKTTVEELNEMNSKLNGTVGSLKADLITNMSRTAVLHTDLQKLELEYQRLLEEFNTQEEHLKSQKQIPTVFFQYLESLITTQRAFQDEKAALVGQIVDLKRKLATNFN